MTGHARLAGLAVLLTAGCNPLWGLDDLAFDPAPSAPGGGGEGGEGGRGGSGAAAGMGGDGGVPTGGLGGGGAGGSGGVGGVIVSLCGDGTITPPDEVCDDGGIEDGDGCSSTCAVECGAADEFEDPLTHHCYAFHSNNTDWNTAVDQCAAWHGDLASVTSEAERSFLGADVGNNAWIGGNDIVGEGIFQWHNGELWLFEAWSLGAPSLGFNSLDCVVLTGGLFDDRDCAQSNNWLCERSTGLP
jgi:cysteine-rich repeat protein